MSVRVTAAALAAAGASLIAGGARLSGQPVDRSPDAPAPAAAEVAAQCLVRDPRSAGDHRVAATTRPMQSARLWIEPPSAVLPVGDVVTVSVRVGDVADLYGFELRLEFDEAVVAVVDSDPAAPGTQIAPGDFLPGETVINQAENGLGTIHYAASLKGPQQGASGSGELAGIALRGVRAGRAYLTFTQAVLSDPRSEAIPTGHEGGDVIVQGPTDAPFTVAGVVTLERRSSSAGANVCRGGHCSVTSDGGAFELPDVVVGDRIVATHPSYLRSERPLTEPPAQIGGRLELPGLTLLGGDVDQDGRIHLIDGALVGMAMRVPPVAEAWYRVRDITDDGDVDVLDIVAVQYNWDRRAPGPWPDATPGPRPVAGREPSPDLASEPRAVVGWDLPDEGALGPTAGNASVAFEPASSRAEGLGVPMAVKLVVEDVIGLYAFSVRVSYDPAVVRVRDAVSSMPGVQLSPGDFLDFESWIVLRNVADNSAGVAELAITQTGRTPGRDGSGPLGTVLFEGVGRGTSELAFVDPQLLASDYPDTRPITVTGRTGSIAIGGDRYLVHLPSLSLAGR